MKQTTAPTTTPAKTHGSQPFFGRPAQTSLSAEQTEPAFFGPAPFIQAKLTIGAPDDPYEREADAVAEQVVQRMSAADNDPAGTADDRMRKDKMIQEKPLVIQRMPLSVQRKCAACEEEEKLQKKEEEKPVELEGGIQRKPIFESNGDEESSPGVQPPGPMIQRKCAACEKEEQEAVQRKPAGGGEMTASPDVSSRLSASKGGGSPLPATVQNSMGGALGADLSGVRVHTDSRAEQLNRDLGAQAFTHGSDVYFGAGKFSPGTRDGDRLLAHELVHVGQQGYSKPLQRMTAAPVEKELTNLTPRAQRTAHLIQPKCVACEEEETLQKKEEEEMQGEEEKILKTPVLGSDGEDENRSKSGSGEPSIRQKPAEKELVQCKSNSSAEIATSQSLAIQTSYSESGQYSIVKTAGTELSMSSAQTNRGDQQLNRAQPLAAMALKNNERIDSGIIDPGMAQGDQPRSPKLRQNLIKDTLQRSCSTTQECLDNHERTLAELQQSIFNHLTLALRTEQWDLNGEISSALLVVMPNEPLETFEEKIEFISNDSLTDYFDGMIGYHMALIYLNRIFAVTSLGNFPDLQINVPINYILSTISRHFATALLGELPGAPLDLVSAANEAEGHIIDDIVDIVQIIQNPYRILQLDLEATLDLLVRLRGEFSGAQEREIRARTGAQIGELGRRAILINQALLSVIPQAQGAAPTPLDEVIRRVQSDIARIRSQEQTERDTLTQLGNSPSLLRPHGMSLTNTLFDLPNDANSRTIGLQEAFPQASDDASNRFMSDLDARIQQQMADLASLHNTIIPQSPSYNLAEFNQVFSRWFSFFSLQEEQQHPSMQFFMGMMGQPYQLMGSGALSGPSAVTGALGRAFLMNHFANLMQNVLGRPNTQFLSNLPTPSRVGAVRGTAQSPLYEFGEMYPTPNRRGVVSSEAGSREEFARPREQDTATRFSGVAGLPQDQQSAGAVQAGIATSEAAIFGLRTVEAAEGWSYLIDVYDIYDINHQTVLSREHRVISPEVSRYIMAYQQHRQTIGSTHQPTFDGRSIGEPAMQARGVEGAQANAVDIYLRGVSPTSASSRARSLQQTRATAREQMGGTPSIAMTSTDRLFRDFDLYFDGFYEARQEPEYRLATIFHIANVQFGIAADIINLLNPENIAKMLAEALRVSFIRYGLELFGPVGSVVSTAYGSYLSAQGVSDLAAIVSIAEFLRSASQISSFNGARAWSYMTPAIVSDMSELFEDLVTTPVTRGFEHFTREQPRTPRELADMVRNSPLMEHPETRLRLLEGIDSRIRELEAQGALTNRTDPEYDALIHFRDELLLRSSSQQSRLESNPDMELPGRRLRSEDTDRFEAGRVRTEAERTALHQAMASHPDVPLIENPTLHGNSVRVYYQNGRLRMEVGPLADASHVQAHLNTVRHLKRYQGVVGSIRRLIERVGGKLRLLPPDYGTRGFEARQELEKLNSIMTDLQAKQALIDQRAERLSSDSARAANEAELHDIDLEIDSIRSQIEIHTRDLNSYEQGRGFIAADDLRDAQRRGHAIEQEIASIREQIDISRQNASELPGIIEKLRQERRPGQRVINLDALSPREREVLQDVFHDVDIETMTLAEVQQGRTRPRSEEQRLLDREQRAITNLRDSMRPLYDRVRAASPGPSVRDQVLRSAGGNDQVSGARPPSGELHVDHIVPLRDIVDMPGFRDLNWEDQTAVANHRANLRAVDAGANLSRQDRSWADQFSARATYSQEALQTIIQTETRLRQELQVEITRRLTASGRRASQ